MDRLRLCGQNVWPACLLRQAHFLLAAVKLAVALSFLDRFCWNMVCAGPSLSVDTVGLLAPHDRASTGSKCSWARFWLVCGGQLPVISAIARGSSKLLVSSVVQSTG